MSDAMDILLNSILLEISNSDLIKFKALMDDWNEIKSQIDDLTVEEKKDDDHVKEKEMMPAVVEQDNEDNEMVIWFRDKLKLPEYLDLFVSEGFDDLWVVADLTETHLKELGITKMGHRMKLLREIKKWKKKRKQEVDSVARQATTVLEGRPSPARVMGPNVQDTLR